MLKNKNNFFDDILLCIEMYFFICNDEVKNFPIIFKYVYFGVLGHNVNKMSTQICHIFVHINIDHIFLVFVY